MATVAATEFKARCLELMDRVAERRETYVITKRGKPVARLVPVKRQPKDSIFGWLRGKATIKGDIISPAAPASAWETLREWDELNAPDQPKRGKARRARRSRR
jgi:prevent-host-death family protein